MDFSQGSLSCEIGRAYFFNIMNWKDKSSEIAVAIINKMNCDSNGNYTRQEVLDGLTKAALDGMRHECDCWVKNTK